MFPFDFTSLSTRRATRTRYTRALWDGARLQVFAEKGGNVTKVYDQPVTEFAIRNPMRARWLDPESGREFSLMKSTGCGCNYRDLSINPMRAQNLEALEALVS